MIVSTLMRISNTRAIIEGRLLINILMKIWNKWLIARLISRLRILLLILLTIRILKGKKKDIKTYHKKKIMFQTLLSSLKTMAMKLRWILRQIKSSVPDRHLLTSIMVNLHTAVSKKFKKSNLCMDTVMEA